jgi:hypothetical protein
VPFVLRDAVRRLSRNDYGLWLWVPAPSAQLRARAGTTISVIASQRGARMRAPLARNDEWIQFRILAARCVRGLPEISFTLQTEGAGKAGCALHPRSHGQLAQTKTPTSIQVQRRQSDFPCAMVLTAASYSCVCKIWQNVRTGGCRTNRPSLDLSPIVLEGHKSLPGSVGQVRCLPQPEQLHGLRARTEQGRELDDGTK